MNERTVRICPYEHCRWEYTEPPVTPIRDLTVEENVRIHVAAVEFECRKHLDGMHPGWTVEDLERRAIEQQVRTVFKASPFGPTVPRVRWGSEFR